MFKLVFKTSFLFVFFIVFSIQSSVSFETQDPGQIHQLMKKQEISKSLKISPDYGKIPLYFIPNEGQVSEEALFYAKTSRYTLWLTKAGLYFDSIRREHKDDDRSHRTHLRQEKKAKESIYKRDVSRMFFLNAKKELEVIPIDKTKHNVNYFRGDDSSKWRTNIQTSRAILYKELYQNIDLKIYGIEKQIEYDFIVKPGGEVADVCFMYKGVKETKIDKEGNLVIETEFGELVHAEPVSYQEIEGKKVGVGARFKEIARNTYGFEIKEYNKNYKLTIDPLVLVYSTYLGGSDWDYGSGIAVDSEGAVYVTGYTESDDFPTKNPIQGHGWLDIFITKINPEGTALVYSTYLGSSGEDWGSSIAVDPSGAAYVTGATWYIDFPTKNPIQPSNAGGVDNFIAKISPSGSALVYSTYLGGSDYEWGDGGIAVDKEGSVYVTGETWSFDYPTQNPIQGSNTGYRDAFITKINPLGTYIVYSTYLGGSRDDIGRSIAVDSQGAAYITGGTDSYDFPTKNPIQSSHAGGDTDVFVTKINSSGSALVYSTYLGGSDGDGGSGIAVDSAGAAYITGGTDSYDFPIKDPIQGSKKDSQDAYVTKINPSGTAFVYSTFLGGSYGDGGSGIAVDSAGAAYITGGTDSYDFPTKNPIQSSHAGGDTDVFVTKLNFSGSALVYSTYLGGHDDETGSSITVDSAGNAYVTGDTWSADFPVQNPFQGSNAGYVDAFIAKLSFTSTYSLTIAAGEGGTTRPKPGAHTYDAGTKAKIEATPYEGYKFSHWSGDASGTDNPIKITMDSDKSVTANFIRQYTLTITSGPGGTTDPIPGTYTFDSGTEVAISAIPEGGYRFGGWSGDVTSTDNPTTIAMNSDISIEANFIRQYTLTLTSGPGGTTQPSPGTYVYDEGTEVTLSYIPDTHCRFSHWSGDASGTSDPLTITMDSDKNVVANFIRIIYAPQNFTGQKVLNRSLSQAEYINFLTWQANSNNVSIVKYRIYQVEGDTQSLLVELNANAFDYWHRGVERDKQYAYALVAVNDEGREGDRAFITVQ